MCESEHVHLCEQNVLILLSCQSLVCVTGVHICIRGTMLYNAQVSTELVRRVTKVDSDFSTVPLSLPLPGLGYKTV